jgi:multimeric flavodoxin WrbA
MKVVAINASPSMDRGNTAVILEPFLNGLRDEGAEIELLHTWKLRIKPCLGEFSCWFRTPGRCAQKDDMEILLPKLAAADVLVFATPVFVDGMAGPLKTLWDRMLPLVEPRVELRGGHCRHPLRETPAGGPGKVVLVANCGFWEKDNFDPLVAHVQAMCRNTGREFAGALLRPHGPVFSALASKGNPGDDILDAAREAGRELARRGSITPQTLERISRPLLPLEAYLANSNRKFEQLLAETPGK